MSVLCPEGPTRVFEGAASDVNGLEGFAVIAPEAPRGCDGFTLAATKQHRRAETLGALLHAQWCKLPWPAGWRDGMTALCRRTGVASVVGDRTTYVPVPGLREFYYVRAGAAVAPGGGWTRMMDALMSAGGLGHLPVIGATAASAAVCVAALVFGALAPAAWWWPVMVALALAATVLCALGERWAQRYYVAHDPREVVLDEVAGMAVALVLAGSNPWAVVAAFFAFRFFDIFKIGVRWVERPGWPGGIVWDDVLAGLYAGASVLVATLVLAR